MKSNRFFALLLALAMLLSMSALAESVTLTDMTGHEITIDEPVTRIVVLQPSDAEILCALGAQDTIVGRGTYVDYPETILDVPVVASGSNTNIEEILALNPQVVVMTTMSQTEEQIAALEQAGVKVVVSSAQDIAGVYTAITLLGELVDKNDEAAALIADMKAAFADVAEKAAAANVSGKTVYFEISPLPYGIWSAGQGTFMDELATLCGVTNVLPRPAALVRRERRTGDCREPGLHHHDDELHGQRHGRRDGNLLPRGLGRRDGGEGRPCGAGR